MLSEVLLGLVKSDAGLPQEARLACRTNEVGAYRNPISPHFQNALLRVSQQSRVAAMVVQRPLVLLSEAVPLLFGGSLCGLA